MATTITEIVDRCLSGIGDLPSFDLVERLAVPLPVEMICHILGIDRSEYGRVKRWSDAFAAAAGGVFSSPAERNELMLTTIKEFSTYFVPLIEARRVVPRNDLVSAMVAAIDNESLSNVETLMMAITIMVAGNETTTNLIGNTVVELLTNPDQLKLLLADPNLLPAAVDRSRPFDVSDPVRISRGDRKDRDRRCTNPQGRHHRAPHGSRQPRSTAL